MNDGMAWRHAYYDRQMMVLLVMLARFLHFLKSFLDSYPPTYHLTHPLPIPAPLKRFHHDDFEQLCHRSRKFVRGAAGGLSHLFAPWRGTVTVDFLRGHCTRR
eukprot:scaffold1041_cov93-Skeletonema_dohrnii-CCMP3373.AAC.15